ncbi:MAG: ISKra4 family transposase, partial [Dermatophilaceae bacterium]
TTTAVIDTHRLRVRRGKRGLWNREGDRETLTVLAGRVAEIAAAEARALVHTAAGLVSVDGSVGVLEAIERAAQQSAAAIGLAALDAVINWASQRTTLTVRCPHDDAHRVRMVARRTKQVRTLLGRVEIRRGYYHCHTCQRAGVAGGFAPFDDHLGVSGTSLSPGLSRASALAGAEMPYAKGFDLISTVTGLDLASVSTLARTTRTEGARARALIDAEHQKALDTTPRPIPAAWTNLPDRCYVILDGTGAPMLPSETRGRLGKNGERAGTREVKIGCFFTQTGLDPVTGKPVQDPGSVSYISTFDTAPEFSRQVKAEYSRRGLDQIRQPIVLGDGAKWIWAIAGERFPQATQIVDYYHAIEHLCGLTKLLANLLDNADAWKTHLIDRLDLGDTPAIAAAVDALDLPTRAPDLAKQATTEVGYFTGNHHRMQYADFHANGYYIGSGPVESACNTIVKQRAKRAGMHWTIPGLDPVLALRTLRQSQREHILWPTPQT